jgi:hypothetical protein
MEQVTVAATNLRDFFTLGGGKPLIQLASFLPCKFGQNPAPDCCVPMFNSHSAGARSDE